MTLTLFSALSMFILIALSTAVFFTAKRLKVPYTVLLVFVGLLLVPLAHLPYLETVFGFLDDMVLTPELLFYIFLPVLIFESGFNMSMRKMLDCAWAVSLLSVVSLVISTVLVAALLYYVLPLIGIEMPFMMALLFGAIISPTDPVAVLSIFRECGVPKRLAMIFEGESLFNDGTAVALFLVLLSVALEGYNGAETIVGGVLDFVIMIVMGIILGLVMATIFSKAIRYTQKNEFVTVTLLLISAHMTFIFAELINHAGYFHVSSIIATTVSSLFLGNYSRNILSGRTDEYLGKLIEHMAFVVNSLVFLMAGLLFASSGVDFKVLWLPIAVTVVCVAFARIVAVYAVTKPLNALKLESDIPASWEKLLSWGSLRGSLSIIIVLLIPADFTMKGWALAYPPRDFLLALTIGCILATLFIKAPLMTTVMKRFKVNLDDPLKDAHESDLGLYYLVNKQTRLTHFKSKGFVTEEYYAHAMTEIGKKIADVKGQRASIVDKHGMSIFEQSIHLSMVYIEKAILKKLFGNKEVNEKTYRKILSKLTLQEEKIEMAQHNHIDPKVYTDRKDVFDRLVNFVLSPFEKKDDATLIQGRFEYYRAQMIMARKAVEAIDKMQALDGALFYQTTYECVRARYKTYEERNAAKMNALISSHREILNARIHELQNRTLCISGTSAFSFFHHYGLADEEMEEHLLSHYTIEKAVY